MGHTKYHTPNHNLFGTAAGHIAKSVIGNGKHKPTPKSAHGKTRRRLFESRVAAPVAGTAQHNDLMKGGVRLIMHKFAPCNPKEGRWKYIDQNQGQCTSAAGAQGVTDIGYFNLPIHYVQATTTMAALGTTANRTNIGSGFFGMNPYQATTGGQASGNTSISGSSGMDERLLLEKIEIKYTFASGSFAPVEFDLYVVTPKTLTMSTGSPLTNWNSCLSTEALGTNASMVQQTTFGYPTNLLVGQKPGQNANWLKTYKILHEKKFVLLPGENYDYTISLHYNEIYDRFMMGQAASASSPIPHKSVAIFAVQRGALCKDTAGSLQWTYANSEVGFAVTNEYFFQVPKGIANKVQTALAFPTLLATATGTLRNIDDTDISQTAATVL